MKRYGITGLVLAMATTAVYLASCGQPDFQVREGMDVLHEVKVNTTVNGEVVAIPDRAVEGTEIRFVVNPEPGYRLTALRFHAMGVSNIVGGNITNVSLNSQRIYSFDLPRGGVWVTAEFAPLLSGQHSVSLQTGDQGHVIVTPSSGPAGTNVRIFNDIEPGYSYGPGYPRLVGAGASWVPGREGFEFTIGSENVTVLTEFARPDNVEDILANARRAMDAGEFDIAFNYYEIAWQAENTNEEAIFYSALGRLLSIGTDSRARVWTRRLGLLNAPGSINEWLDLGAGPGSWLDEYTDGDDVHRLPALAFPNGFPGGGFVNFDIVHLNGGTRYLWGVLLFWNFIGSNPNGFNDFLDDGLEHVFGNRFEEAALRAARFPENGTVALHPVLMEKLSLYGLYGDAPVAVGRAELDVLFAFIRSLKAGFEWAASYNWEMDLTMLRVMVSNADTFNSLLSKVLDTVDERIETDRNFSILPRFLPLRSRLLRVRNPAMMANAKANFAEAAHMLDAAMGTFYTRLDPAAQGRLAWLAGTGGFAGRLRTAMDSGGDFFFPGIPRYGTLFQAMEGRGEWVSRADSQHGVNLGNFFTPGFLTADRLVLTESGGRVPVFFGFEGAGAGTPIADGGEIADFDTFSLRFADSFGDVFVRLRGRDAADYLWASDVFPDLFPQGGDPVERLNARNNVTRLYRHYQRR